MSMTQAFRESTTLKIVIAQLVVLDYMAFTGVSAEALQEFGIASGAIIAIWLGREWRKAHYTKAIE